MKSGEISAQHTPHNRQSYRTHAEARSSSGSELSGAPRAVKRCMKIKPELLLPPTVPRLEKKPLLFGSAIMILLTSSWFAFIASNEMPCAASV